MDTALKHDRYQNVLCLKLVIASIEPVYCNTIDLRHEIMQTQ